MSVAVLNTFDSGVVTAIAGRLRVYLDGLGADYSAFVAEQTSPDTRRAVQVTVSATELEEMVYQSGHYRVAVDVTVQVDATEQNEGGADRFRGLSGAVLDALQQEDLASQLNAATDPTGRAYCVVQGLVLEQSRLEDIADWVFRRTYSLNLYGFNPGQG